MTANSNLQGGPMAGQTQPDAKPVLVISSHVMAGAVGNRAASFALERLGFPVWEVPTVILPWHPGHGPSTRNTIDASLFAHSLEDLERHPDFANLGALLSGYMGSVAQVEAVARLVDGLKAANPDSLYVCDPVMGEENGLYIAEEIAIAIRDLLIPRADIITPNRFEFNWLTGKEARNNADLINNANQLGCPTTLITSAFPMMRNAIANLLIEAPKPLEETAQDATTQAPEPARSDIAIMAEHPIIPNPPNGTGDMVAALFLAYRLSGQSGEQALKRAASGILEVVSRSVRSGYADLEVARFGDRFTHPMAMVHMRMVNAAPRRTVLRPN
ncbi:pyridoxal kinase [Cohaesibacter sp. CAU 1516]|uniref:pyridoxal kinase n=1 Tax=Cohaesibacter sp. CAU 1516 TaxID=2576038 RepID=UPI001FF05CCD|nr:pyridoxal kinase [Cohaesibacter sp. CAU 1516]